MLYWKSVTRVSLVLNALFGVGWLCVDILLLRPTTIHGPNPPKLTVCDWHGIACPCLVLLTAMIGIFELCAIKGESVPSGVQTRLKCEKTLAWLTFAFILVSGVWLQIKVITEGNNLKVAKSNNSVGDGAIQLGIVKLLNEHKATALYLEYGLSYLAILLSLAMAITYSMLARAVQGFSNLEKLMG